MADPNEEKITVFAKTNFRNQEVPFGIKTDDRRRHMYVLGKTGMGKTTLMENMAIQDIRNGHGIAFLDPHGDSVQRILDSVPASRINDVVYFNPADLEYPIAFNILEAVDTKYKHLVASGLMGVFTKIWASLWSARMEYILNNTILALLDSPGNTLLGITRMYVDKKYRKKIVDNVKDPMVRAFWTDEFANYAEKYRTEAVAPIQNKVGQFLSSGIIRNIVGQPKSTIDLRDIMDNQKILIMDLSKGKVGEDNSALLGAMVVTKLQLAAMSRTDIPEHERKDFYLYVDEFQNFATESFATILSEARKYRLCLIVGHQYIAQLEQDKSTKVRDAIFGNVGTMVVFRVGAADAEFLETEFEPAFLPTDLVNLPKYNIILKLMINGVASEPFSATTVPSKPEYFSGNGEKVIKVSRERYANPVVEVEDKITRWMGAEFHQDTAESQGEERQERNERPRAQEEQPRKERQPEVVREAPKMQAMAIPVEAPVPPTPQNQNPIEKLLEASHTPAPLEISEPQVEAQLEAPAPEPMLAPAPFEEKITAAPVRVELAAPAPEQRRPEPRNMERRPMPAQRPQNSQQSRSNNHDRNRDRDRDRNRHGRHEKPKNQSQKRDNPIWSTVGDINAQKAKEEKERIVAALNALGRLEQPQRPAQPQPAPKQEQVPSVQPSNHPPEQSTSAPSSGRTVLTPNQPTKI